MYKKKCIVGCFAKKYVLHFRKKGKLMLLFYKAIHYFGCCFKHRDTLITLKLAIDKACTLQLQK